MEYQIGRCTAPCVGEINEADYKKDIEDTKTILKGNFKELEKKMRHEMLDASEQEKFEQAATIRDKLEQIENRPPVPRSTCAILFESMPKASALLTADVTAKV